MSRCSTGPFGRMVLKLDNKSFVNSYGVQRSALLSPNLFDISQLLYVVSDNLHVLNNGGYFLVDICNNLLILWLISAVQERCLTSNNLAFNFV